jgi:hypothetical protein
MNAEHGAWVCCWLTTNQYAEHFAPGMNKPWPIYVICKFFVLSALLP